MDYETVPIRVTPIEGGFTVVCRGSIQGNSEMIQSELDRVVKVKPKLVTIDMAALEYITSSGIGVLVNFRKRIVEGGGTFKTINASPRILNILKMSQLLDFLGVQKSAGQ